MTWNKSRGMTLTELLAVLLILSLLATIAVPVYVARQEDARVRVAIGECREIAMAEETVAAMHGFYVPFQLLDDLPPHPDDTVITSDEERIDEYPVGPFPIFLIIPTIRAEEQFLGTQLELRQGYDGGGDPNPRVRSLVDNWSGPFINFQRFWYDVTSTAYNGPTDPDYRDSDDMFRDFPLDPWGNPYRFYSPIGIIGNGQDELGENFDFDTPDTRFSNGELTDLDDERFQRYAVVSYGRDGLSDTQIPNADNIPDNDIYYEFGTDGLSRNFGKF